VPLLKGAYECLIELGTILYPRSLERLPRQPLKLSTEEERYWDRLMRNGILMGYAHSGENAEIAEVLIRYMGFVIGKMGIYCVKHLKVLFSSLGTPFFHRELTPILAYSTYNHSRAHRSLCAFSSISPQHSKQHPRHAHFLRLASSLRAAPPGTCHDCLGNMLEECASSHDAG
jgi:hypothetical protein